MRKNCLNCEKVIFKKRNASMRSWVERVKYCSTSCRVSFLRGKSPSEATRKKMSEAHRGKSSWNKGIPLSDEHRKAVSISLRGEKHWNWQGGIKPLNAIERNRMEYKQWREAVFKRDGFKCKIANGDCVHDVHAHHILRFSEYPELRFNVKNGITLCENHHPMKRSHEQELAPFFKKLIS